MEEIADGTLLTKQQSEILKRMRDHAEPVRHTKMGFEIDGRYLCDSRAMSELVRLKMVAATYVDHPGGGRVRSYIAAKERTNSSEACHQYACEKCDQTHSDQTMVDAINAERHRG